MRLFKLFATHFALLMATQYSFETKDRGPRLIEGKPYPKPETDEEKRAKGLQPFDIDGVIVWARTESNARYNLKHGKF